MKTFTKTLKAYCSDESGAAAIEYGLLLGLLVIAIIGALTTLGQETGGSFQNFHDTLEAAKPTSSP